MITDKDILNYFVNSDGKIISFRINKNNIEKVPEFKEYLLHRYPNDDFISYTFTVKRILHNVEELPLCENCGKKIYKISARWCSTKCQLTDKKFIQYRDSIIDKELAIQHFHETCIKKYGVSAPAKCKEIYAKVKKTNKEKYGNEYVCASEYAIQKNKETCLQRYGVINGGASKEAQEKIRKTKLERYGNAYFTNNDLIQQTMLERYGVKSYMSYKGFIEQSRITKNIKYGDPNYTNREKAAKTCLLHYGVNNYGKTKESILLTHTDEVKQKIIDTKRKNHTFNTSKPEEECYKLLLEIYNDVVRQYSSNEYPFSCDFYIPSLDLYIEYNGSWTHGGHPFDEQNNDDIKKYNQLNESDSQYNKNAAYNWRYRDVKKRETAKQNNLNYIEFWNLDEVKIFISKQ